MVVRTPPGVRAHSTRAATRTGALLRALGALKLVLEIDLLLLVLGATGSVNTRTGGLLFVLGTLPLLLGPSATSRTSATTRT